ncbi:unnamed protein product [Cylindrotheca closterium]|uniref:Mannosyltransferase n=1 Tax=Cylindrotheca closterium TaxID=2856 RepID=A0AAD2CB56_9STRA|nr:unnamed protein product [Cylindrotheca closterium]
METSRAFGICQCLLFSSFLLDLTLCPHSKVEESFQLQATHDLIYFGIRPALFGNDDSSETPYDHLQYPGVVPRSFIGPGLLASICTVLRLLLLPVMDIAQHPMMMQFLSRFCLLSILVFSWSQFARALDKKFRGAGAWMLLLTACQFHMPFYASRMLPNVFALAMVLNSYAAWIDANVSRAATLLVVATAIFRCDLLLLLGSVGLVWLITKKLSIVQALKIGVASGAISLLLTIPLDSALWQRLLWAEGEVFYYNAILGKSSDWGTSPWHWYYSSALPKSMLLTVLLVPFSFLRIVEYLMGLERRVRKASSSSSSVVVNLRGLLDRQWLEYLLPVLGFVTLYSFLAHKEVRFIFPAIPMLNALAAVGIQRLSSLAFPAKGKERMLIASLAFYCGLFCILASLIGSLTFVAVSHQNYPGGDALLRLSVHISNLQLPPSTELHVHIDVASAMSGVSLFGQRAAEAQTKDVNWIFHKSGYEEEHSLEASAGREIFTHVLSEDANFSPDFHVIDTIQGNPSLNLRKFRIHTTDAIYVLERIDWGQQYR